MDAAEITIVFVGLTTLVGLVAQFIKQNKVSSSLIERIEGTEKKIHRLELEVVKKPDTKEVTKLTGQMALLELKLESVGELSDNISTLLQRYGERMLNAFMEKVEGKEK